MCIVRTTKRHVNTFWYYEEDANSNVRLLACFKNYNDYTENDLDCKVLHTGVHIRAIVNVF